MRDEGKREETRKTRKWEAEEEPFLCLLLTFWASETTEIRLRLSFHVTLTILR